MRETHAANIRSYELTRHECISTTETTGAREKLKTTDVTVNRSLNKQKRDRAGSTAWTTEILGPAGAYSN